MKYNLDKYTVIDCEADTLWGLDPWHPDFKLESMAFYSVEEDGYKVQKLFTTNKNEMKELLTNFIKNEYTLVVYNLSYEHPVILSQLGVDIGVEGRLIDVMRLYQYSTKRKGKERSLKLTTAYEEFTGRYDFKSYYLKILVNLGIATNEKDAKAKVGALPIKDLEAYNLMDCYVTEEVMWGSLSELATIGYSWEMDHEVYITDVKRNTYSYLRGLKIDFDKALANLKKIEDKRRKIIALIHSEYAEQIELFNRTYDFKKAKKRTLNLGSNKQLAFLCMDIMQMVPKHFTVKGNPSFAKGFLGQWGDFGLLIRDLNKTRAPRLEILKILSLASVSKEGRLHAQVKAGLTSTGRSKSCKEIK